MEAARKNRFFLVARPLRGGGGKGLATKEKERFFSCGFHKNGRLLVSITLEKKPGNPLKKDRFFCGFPYGPHIRW